MKLFCLKIENIEGYGKEYRYERFEDVSEAAGYTALLVRRNGFIDKVDLYECTDESMPKVRHVIVGTFYRYF